MKNKINFYIKKNIYNIDYNYVCVLCYLSYTKIISTFTNFITYVHAIMRFTYM